MNVEIIKGLVDLYGENVILDAMINDTDNLTRLMAKDGKNYEELRQIMDSFHEYQYYDKGELSDKMLRKFCEARAFLKDIKNRRNVKNKSNPQISDSLPVPENSTQQKNNFRESVRVSETDLIKKETNSKENKAVEKEVDER